MKKKGALEKLLGFVPNLKRPIKTTRPADIPADPIDYVFAADELQGVKVDYQLDVNVNILRSIMAGNSDFVIREFNIGPNKDISAAVAYIDGLTNSDMVHKTILSPMMLNKTMFGNGPGGGIPFDQVMNNLLTAADVQVVEDYNTIVDGMLSGGAVVFINAHVQCFLVSLVGYERRSISEPITEGLVRGPREGFTENLRTNTSLLRRRLKSPNLIFESITVGRVTNTKLAISYVRGLCDPTLVEEVKKRLSRIKIDSVMESSYIEEMIEDSPYSPFPQVQHTERPDKVAESLMAGRVAIFTDNTPFVLVVPGEFVTYIQSPEDYYERYFFASFVRLLRYFALGMSLLLPSLYIAIITYHQEMIPTPLLISIAASREGVPFPALVEALIMEISFEALREAGLRLPRPVGQAISIVGALVVGEAAVSAGIVSPLMVIVVAITGIASFVNPSFSMAMSTRLLRFPLMLLAGTLGLFGVMVGLLVILVHMAGLRSFGVPYLAPFTPFNKEGMKDALIRAPWWALQNRPQQLSKDNPYRMKPDLKPGPWQNHMPDDEQQKQNGRSYWPLERQRQMEIYHMAQGGENNKQQAETDTTKEQGRKRRTRRTHKKK